jgi:methyl-accepting chemotaxis protein
MHPTVPALEGEVMSDSKYNNALGIDKNLFQAFAEVTGRDGQGFVDYLWPKPTKTGLTERTEKMSYVKLHKPTGWIIGSGAYLDSIDQVIDEKRIQIMEQKDEMIQSNVIVSVIFIMLSLVISYMFAGNLAKPISNLTKVSEYISKGKNLDAVIDEVNRRDEIGDLAKSIDRLKTSVKIMIGRMSK